jgi:hypothetical protein
MYSTALVVGPHSLMQARGFAAINFDEATINKLNYFPFVGTSETDPLQFKMLLPGNIAVCYCAYADDQGACWDDKYSRFQNERRN